MFRSLTAALALGLALILAPPAKAQPADPQMTELLQSLAEAVAAIEPDPAEVEALTVKVAALEAELTATRAQLASLETGRAERLAEAQRLWRQLGTFLMAEPHVIDPPADPGLTKFSAAEVIRHNYAASLWHPIEGYQSKMEPGWTFDFGAVQVQPDGSLLHRLTNTAAASIKWEGEKRLKKTRGLYQVRATFEARPGVIAAPVWLYSEGWREGGHELDIEIMDGRIEYNLHTASGAGFNMRSVEKDLGGHVVDYFIDRRDNDRIVMRVVSLTDGWTDELVITPAQIAAWKAAGNAPADLKPIPSDAEMFPATELWVANQQWGLDPWNGDLTPWSGKWVPLPAGEAVDMLIIGYRFTH
ncbi:hypothetical protein [Hyphomonas sp.]|uniref:hypothetical protein n=1 Tax=Hyphomonas sp. TaxID=87 RepID=UPI0025B8ABA1|nr:hypothetical protein [Hyphomonas sp.]MBI1401470.1 hypothetical protein [Hyphomonas sp.]